MRRYETIVIVDPDVTEEDRKVLFERIAEIITQQNGELIAEDPWGIKKLAYEIKKKNRGFYCRFDFCGLGALVDELERQFRIDDRIMKYLTVLLNPEADVEKIKADLAAAQSAPAGERPTTAVVADDSGEAPAGQADEEEDKTEEDAADEE